MRDSGHDLKPAKETQAHRRADPPPDAVATAMAQALCRLARIDPALSAAKPAGRVFATSVLASCVWAVNALVLPVETHALTWAVMALALCLSLFRLWACC